MPQILRSSLLCAFVWPSAILATLPGCWGNCFSDNKEYVCPEQAASDTLGTDTGDGDGDSVGGTGGADAGDGDGDGDPAEGTGGDGDGDGPGDGDGDDDDDVGPDDVDLDGVMLDITVAQYDVGLSYPNPGDLAIVLSSDVLSNDVYKSRAAKIAEVILVADPDVILLNNFDTDNAAVDTFMTNEVYLNNRYAYHYTPPCNLPTGATFSGQGCILLLSKFAFSTESSIRTYEDFLWWKVPNDVVTDSLFPLLEGQPGHLTTRLFSRTFADVPLAVKMPDVPDKVLDVHFLITHTAEPRPNDSLNTRRNHDEIRFIADYIYTEANAYISTPGVTPLPPDKKFVILGNLNADPELDGYEWQAHNAMQYLLNMPRILDPFDADTPASNSGALAKAECDGDNNTNQRHDTFDSVGLPGGRRVDVVLPSTDFAIVHREVLWPSEGEPGFEFIEGAWACDEDPSPSGYLGPHHLVGARLSIWVS